MIIKPLTLMERMHRAAAGVYTRMAAHELLHVGEGVLVDSSVRFTGSRQVWLGDRAHVGPRARLNTDQTGEMRIGARVTIGPNVILDATRRLDIGDGTQIGPSVYISTGRHRFNGPGAVRYQGGERYEPITIGRQVQIGAHAVVLPGTTIEDGAVVAANAVVGGTVPRSDGSPPAS